VNGVVYSKFSSVSDIWFVLYLVLFCLSLSLH